MSQTWNATHEQINGGNMDGFVRSVNATQPMGYYPAEVLPFAYGLAATFTLANRWFCSAPCQTFPNRRFLMAGTAYGNIATDVQSLGDPPPPNGTIFDRLHAHGISWRDYFTDIPYTAIIPSIVEKYPGNLATLDHFFDDCAKGTLPAVSFVDPGGWRGLADRQDTRLAAGRRLPCRHAGDGRRRRGGAAGHVLRRGVGPPRRRGRPALSGLVAHTADLHL